MYVFSVHLRGLLTILKDNDVSIKIIAEAMLLLAANEHPHIVKLIGLCLEMSVFDAACNFLTPKQQPCVNGIGVCTQRFFECVPSFDSCRCALFRNIRYSRATVVGSYIVHRRISDADHVCRAGG